MLADDLRDLVRGRDELLVDATAYGLAGEVWAPFDHVAPGSAAVYPYKVRLPGRGIGQYKASEVIARRQVPPS